MATRLYDEDSPLGSTSAADLDQDIQNARNDFRERLQQGGQRFSGFDNDVDPTEEENDGKPCVGWENQTDRDDTGFYTIVWDHDGVVPVLRQYGSAHISKPNLLELSGNISGVTDPVNIDGVSAGAHARAAFSDAFPVTGYLKRIIYKSSDAAGAPDRILKKIKIVVGTRPVGTNLVVTFRKRTAAQQTASNDPFIDANTTALVDASCTLVAGANYTAEVTITPETLTPGEELVAVWGTTGSAADVTVLGQIE
jgi:hypothetical protein